MRYESESNNNFTKVSPKNILGLFLSAGDGAEGFCRVGHERLDLLHSARDAGQQLDAVGCHCDVVLDANLHTAETQSRSNMVESQQETFKHTQEFRC